MISYVSRISLSTCQSQFQCECSEGASQLDPSVRDQWLTQVTGLMRVLILHVLKTLFLLPTA